MIIGRSNNAGDSVAIEDQATDGGIIGLHVWQSDLDRLDGILSRLSKEGYGFVTVERLIELQGATSLYKPGDIINIVPKMN